MAGEDDPKPGPSEDDLLFQLELFKGLPPRLRKILSQFRRFTAGTAGQTFVQQGEYTEDFHYVLSGSISAYRTDDEGKTDLHEFLAPHTWFGEASAISNQPSLATYKADVPCTLLTIDGGTFKILYKDASNQEFRKRIDERYRRQSLAAHMRTMPVFRSLPKDQLAEIKRHVKFETFPKGKVIAAEGAEADAVYMVRSGAISCTMKLPTGQDKILEYHMNNSSFGERSLTKGKSTWPGTYTTLAPTDVLVISKAAIHSTLGEGTGSLEALQKAALALIHDPASKPVPGAPLGSARPEKSEDELEVLVKGGRVKGGEALVIDLKRCVRCNMCVETCVAVHEDRVPRLSKKGQRTPAVIDLVPTEINLATSCYNCDIPECMMACNYGAIRRDTEGLIRFVYNNCVGCSACVSACPYGVIRYTPPPGSAPLMPKDRFLESIPFLGALFKQKPAAPAAPGAEAPKVLSARGEKVQGKSIKCDLCAGLPFEGCVYNCPTSAISRKDPTSIRFDQDVVHTRVVDGSIADAVKGAGNG